MAIVEYYIGGQGPFLADTVLDADYLSHGGQVIRQDDLSPAVLAELTGTNIRTALGILALSNTSIALQDSGGSGKHCLIRPRFDGVDSDGNDIWSLICSTL